MKPLRIILWTLIPLVSFHALLSNADEEVKPAENADAAAAVPEGAGAGETGDASAAKAKYGEWCDDDRVCDDYGEEPHVTSFECVDHTCICREGASIDGIAAPKPKFTWQTEEKDCYIVHGGECSTDNPSEKCVKNANCNGGTCRCENGKPCERIRVIPHRPPAPPGYKGDDLDMSGVFALSDVAGQNNNSQNYDFNTGNIKNHAAGQRKGNIFIVFGTLLITFIIVM